MTMHGVQTVTEFPQTTVTGTGWSGEDEDPEHHSFEPFITGAENGGSTPEVIEDFDDKQFLADLKWACQWVFNGFSQTTHASWEDLQQEVLIRFWNWLRQYRKKANRKTVFVKIATNVLIDARRSEASLRRQHQRVHLEDLESEPEQAEPKTKIEDQIYLKECIETLSERERVVFDQHFILGESLRELAEKHGVSPAAMSKTRARIIRKLHAR